MCTGVSTITISDTVINKIQRAQSFFIRLALRLPKYVSDQLLHETSGLPYVRDRLREVAKAQLVNISRNPLVQRMIDSAVHPWKDLPTPSHC